MIRLKRMPYHLQKCRRNYKGADYKVCPFNARHEVPEPEFPHHVINCTDKFIVEKDMIHIKRLQEDQNYRERFNGNTDTSPDRNDSINASSQSGHGGNADWDDWEPQERTAPFQNAINELQDALEEVVNSRSGGGPDDWFDGPDVIQSSRQTFRQDSKEEKRDWFDFEDANESHGSSSSPVDVEEKENGFGCRFPQSLGRGTQLRVKMQSDAIYFNEEEQEIPFKLSVARGSIINQQKPSTKLKKERTLGYANFPIFQRGPTPRYNSAFGADRPLSKQAQLQLEQQMALEDGEEEEDDDEVILPKGRGVFGRGVFGARRASGLVGRGKPVGRGRAASWTFGIS